jgi:hypothetical protein
MASERRGHSDPTEMNPTIGENVSYFPLADSPDIPIPRIVQEKIPPNDMATRF